MWDPVTPCGNFMLRWSPKLRKPAGQNCFNRIKLADHIFLILSFAHVVELCSAQFHLTHILYFYRQCLILGTRHILDLPIIVIKLLSSIVIIPHIPTDTCNLTQLHEQTMLNSYLTSFQRTCTDAEGCSQKCFFFGNLSQIFVNLYTIKRPKPKIQ